MRVFEAKKITEFLTDYPFISLEDFKFKRVVKTARKKLANIRMSEFIFKNVPQPYEMVKKFFPIKYESASRKGFTTLVYDYYESDDKIHWVVEQDNGEERHFKLKTECFLERTVEEREYILKKIIERYDKLCGYHIVGNKITDGNKIIKRLQPRDMMVL